MTHSHHEHHHSVSHLDHIGRAFYVGIGLNLIYTIIEFVAGFQVNSLALISDASHNLSDVASLLISLIGLKLTQKASNYTFTYGYKKASILASLINAILLVYISVRIIFEAFERFASPPEMTSSVIMITAFIGVIINTLSAFLFHKGQKEDINIRGAFLHLLVDALVSVGVIVSGIIIHFTQWHLTDVITSCLIAVIILVSTWRLLAESVKLILDGVPKNIDYQNIKQLIKQHPLVCSVHHLHIWALSSSENALTAHLVVESTTLPAQMEKIKSEIRHTLVHQNIQHATFEIELVQTQCTFENCNHKEH